MTKPLFQLPSINDLVFVAKNEIGQGPYYIYNFYFSLYSFHDKFAMKFNFAHLEMDA